MLGRRHPDQLLIGSHNETQPCIGGANGGFLPTKRASKIHQEQQDGGCKGFCKGLPKQPAEVIHKHKTPVSEWEDVVDEAEEQGCHPTPVDLQHHWALDEVVYCPFNCCYCHPETESI